LAEFERMGRDIPSTESDGLLRRAHTLLVRAHRVDLITRTSLPQQRPPLPSQLSDESRLFLLFWRQLNDEISVHAPPRSRSKRPLNVKATSNLNVAGLRHLNAFAGSI